MSNSTAGGSRLQAVPQDFQTPTFKRWIRHRDKEPVAWAGATPSSLYNEREWRTADKIPHQLLAPDWPKEKGGIGISLSKPVFLHGGRLLALDLDACREESGEVSEWAQKVVKLCNYSYTEVTVSGRGLRVWVIVKNCPAIEKRDFDPKGWEGKENENGKKVQCQVFGGDVAGFVTVSGDLAFENTRELQVIDGLGWWEEVFTLPADTPGLSEAEELPPGEGEPPTMDEIQEFIDAHEHIGGPALQRCEWKDLPKLQGKSNSEAWFAFIKLVLRAARGHRPESAKFLDTRCPRWADERLRSKYSDPTKIAKEVNAIARKAPEVLHGGRAVFEVIPGEPPAAPSTNGKHTDKQKGGEEEKKQEIILPWTRQELSELLAEVPTPWVVKHYFRRKQLGVLAAFAGVGKSTLAAAWMMSVLHDQEWCGEKVRGGSVLALVGENRRGFANSLDAYAREHKFGAPPEGRYLEIVDFKLPLSGKEGQKQVRRLIEAVVKDRGEAPAVVVIDTLAAHWAETEDSSEFMAPAMRVLADLAARWNCVVLFLHHVTKAAGKNVMPTLADVRGSGALTGAIDFAFGLCEPEERVVQVKCLKVKNDAEPAPIKLRRLSVSCGVDSEGDEVTAGVFANKAEGVTKAEEIAAQALTRDTDAIVEALRSLGQASSKDAVVEVAHMRLDRGRRCFALALDAGRIVDVGTRRRPIYRPGPEAKASFQPLPPDFD